MCYLFDTNLRNEKGKNVMVCLVNGDDVVKKGSLLPCQFCDFQNTLNTSKDKPDNSCVNIRELQILYLKILGYGK